MLKKWGLFGMLLVLVMSLVAPTKMAAAGADPAKPKKDSSEKRYIVTFKNKVDKSVIQTSKGKIKRDFKRAPSVAVTVSADEAENLKKNALVESVEPDQELRATAQTEDWGMAVSQARQAWNSGFTGKGVKIAVLDSGISLTHEELVVEGGVSFVDDTASYDDDFGHGTHVAGIIAAKDNESGAVGVAPDARLYAVKVLNTQGVGYVSDVIAGIDWAIENGMDIVNLSLAAAVHSPVLQLAVERAYASGLLLVGSAGNAGTADGVGNTLQYPAQYSAVISVGAVDNQLQRAPFSATGPRLDLVAPGVAVTSAYLHNEYRTLSGTSMAAAYVTGALALLKEAQPDSSNIQLRQQLSARAADLGEQGRDAWYGYGLAQVDGQLANVLEAAPPAGEPSPAGGSGPSVTDDTYLSTYAAATGPSVYAIDFNGRLVNDTMNWPSLINAKAITLSNKNVATGYTERFVLYSDNTVKYKRFYEDGVWDDSANWPSLVNAKSIAYSYRKDMNIYRFVLYHNNTVQYTQYDLRTGRFYAAQDGAPFFPSLVNAKGIAYSQFTGGGHVLYNNNVIKNASGTVTASFPALEPSSKSLGTQYEFGYTIDSRAFYTGYLDVSPIISLSSNANQSVYINASPSVITLSGTVTDADNDPVTISATLAGVTKTAVVASALAPSAWTLQWNAAADNIPTGKYAGITVSATSGTWGTASAAYSGTIQVNRLPNTPANLQPGSATAASAPVVAGVLPALSWTFSDPDAGHVQSAYDVKVYHAANMSLVYDTGWVSSPATSFTVPSNVLNRGTTYAWKVVYKDSYGGLSPESPLSFFRTNQLPALIITSPLNGQQFSGNVLTFAWLYSDADGQAQAKFRIQGSRDNGATVGYDSGILSSSAALHTTPPLPDGTWSFTIQVSDGLEWTLLFKREGLIVPNTFEPNDTPAQAFAIDYNSLYSSVIHSAADVDFYRYIAPTAGVDRVTLTMPAGRNYDVFLYDSQMNVLAAGLGTATGAMESVIYPVGAGSTYYIQVVGANGAFSDSPYKLKVSPFALHYQTDYEYDKNGRLIKKQTTGQANNSN